MRRKYVYNEISRSKWALTLHMYVAEGQKLIGPWLAGMTRSRSVCETEIFGLIVWIVSLG